MELSDLEREQLRVAVDRLVPPIGEHPGAAALGAVDYIDGLLHAFDHDPPRIWAGGPFSDRAGSPVNHFLEFIALSPLEELAWRTRIEGSQGIPAREFNGPVVGWQTRYRAGLAALGADFVTVDPATRDVRLDADPDFKALLYRHTCEACYSAPEYGGNRNARGWQAVQFPGDVQPRGYTDDEVEQA